ncbi:hypothetical protein ACFYU9_20015 [Streptomyces sp. NPDC004327]|uniref:hypothetical protein n=1 Tax=Streptomyces sp. NPDC004327 TaxID=3364699 RepID=UPI0036CEFFC0
MVQLTPEQLIGEFQDAVVELYFARKRILALEAENADLKARLEGLEAADAAGPGEPRPA